MGYKQRTRCSIVSFMEFTVKQLAMLPMYNINKLRAVTKLQCLTLWTTCSNSFADIQKKDTTCKKYDYTICGKSDG